MYPPGTKVERLAAAFVLAAETVEETKTPTKGAMARNERMAKPAVGKQKARDLMVAT